jgi:acetolactate synthase-1/2/3 large subunit
MYVSERILHLLEAEGLKTLFGIPDPSFFRMFATAETRGWRVIAPHHEEAGAFMAEGLWRMTGKPGVVVGNQGPGVANLAPAAIAAAKEYAPIIFIAGQRKQIAAQRIRRGRIQYTHQWRNFEAAMKYIGIIEYPEQTDDVVHEALRRAISGAPGPVYIEVPNNAMQAQLELPAPPPPASYRAVHHAASAPALDEAVALIKQARTPILLIGQGAFTSRAHESLAALAHALECPILQCSGGMSSYLEGLEDRTFTYGFSPTAIEAVAKSDLVIAIGTEIGEPVHFGTGHHWTKGHVDRKWIYIESDPTAIGVNRPIDVPLIGDLRDIVPQLVSALKGIARRPPAELDNWVKAHAEHRAQVVAETPTQSSPVHPARFMVEATRVIPKDAVFVRDGGAVAVFSWAYAQLRPRDLLWSQNFGHLGTGLPYALGAQLAVGDSRRVVLMTGDSAFLFHISELETAVRKKLPVVCIVGCDYAWGLEVRGYRGLLGPDSRETEAHWGKVRLDQIAQGFGAHGEFCDRAEDIAPAVTRALASGKPAVVQVEIDGQANARDTPGHGEYLTWYTDFF